MGKQNIKRFAVFASGRGSNFCAIMKAVRAGKLKVDIALVVCDDEKAPVIKRAQEYAVPVALVVREDFADRVSFEDAVAGALEERKIEAIVLAGFMRVLSPSFVRRFPNRIINIHPALLPSFKGAQGIKDAFEYGARVTGVTVHFVDEKVDHGPIILQEAVLVGDKDTLASLEGKIHAVEHRLYPEAIRLFAEGKLRVRGRRVVA